MVKLVKTLELNTVWKIIFVFLDEWLDKKSAAKKYNALVKDKQPLKTYLKSKMKSWTHPSISKYFPALLEMGYLQTKQIRIPVKNKKYTLPAKVYRADLEKILLDYIDKKGLKLDNYELRIIKGILNDELSRSFLISNFKINLKDLKVPSRSSMNYFSDKEYESFLESLNKIETEVERDAIDIFKSYTLGDFLDICVEKLLFSTLYSSKTYKKFLKILNTYGNKSFLDKLNDKISDLKSSDLDDMNKGGRIFLWYCTLLNKKSETFDKLYMLLNRNIWRDRMFRLYQLNMIGEIEFQFDPNEYKNVVDG